MTPTDLGGRRLVVDAMNVIGSRPTGWWRDRDGAVRRLAERLDRLAGVPEPVVLVVDGGPIDDLAEGQHGGVVVRYARRRGPGAADDRIAELVAADPDPPSLTVITSDRELRGRVTALGAASMGAGTFLRLLDDLEAPGPKR